ncbi:MAG: hypothetical protein ACRCS2_11900, partial [Morganella morganii]
MAPGDSRQWRYENRSAAGNQVLMNHLVKGGQLTLSRPGHLSCRDGEVEGRQGKICLLRELTWQGSANLSSNLRFKLSTSLNAVDARYRVEGEWVRLGDSVPISDLANSRGIELFFTPPQQQQREAFWQQLSHRSLADLVEMSFFMPERMQQGDKFVLAVGVKTEEQKPMRGQLQPLSFLLVQDKVSQNRYITSAYSGTHNSALFGVEHPGSGERPAIWYPMSSKVTEQSKSASPEGTRPIVTPETAFSDFADQQGNPQPWPAGFNPILNSQGWQWLQSIAMGEGQLLKYEQNNSNNPLDINNRGLKQAQLTLEQPDNSQCEVTSVQGVAGYLCSLRKVEWKGTMAQQGIRFTLRSDKNADDVRYRVAG